MEKVWSDDGNLHKKFLRTLLNNRVTEMVGSERWLKSLRYKHEEVRWWQKRAGYIFEERGINLYQLIAQAHGECWDNEDEEKCASAKKQGIEPPLHKKNEPPHVKEKPRQTENAISLDHPREICVRRGQKEECDLQVRSSDEGRQIDLQASGKGGL